METYAGIARFFICQFKQIGILLAKQSIDIKVLLDTSEREKQGRTAKTLWTDEKVW